MPEKLNENYSQFFDRYMQRTVVGVLLMAMYFGTQAAKFLVGKSVAEIIDHGNWVLLLLSVVVTLPVVVEYSRYWIKWSNVFLEPDGFIGDICKKAGSQAFSFTLVLLLSLEVISGKYWQELPTDFFIKVILSSSLAVFSLTFLFLNRGGGADGEEDDFDNETAE